MNLYNSFRTLTIGIVLIVLCVPNPADAATCDSLTDSLMISAGTAPAMAADRFGYTHFVWQDPALGVMYAQVGPDGTVTVPATSMYPSHGDGFPNIAVDDAGNAHIIASSSSFTGLLYMKVSQGKRVTLNAFYIEPIDADDIYDYSPSIAVNPVTQLPVVVAQVVSDLDEYEGIFDPILVQVYSTFIASQNLDAGGNLIPGTVFEAWYDIGTEIPSFDVSYPSVAVDNKGVTHVVWIYQDPTLSGLTVGYANSASTTWEEIANTANVNGLEGRPVIIRGSDGNLDVVWSTTTSEVVWTQLSPAGAKLVDNEIVSQPEALANWPSIASGSGQLVCSWTDRREGTNSQIYARSLLNSIPECDVSQSPGAADNGSIAVNSSGNPVYAWQDGRNGSAQIYYRATANVSALNVFDANPQYLDSVVLPQTITSSLLQTLENASTRRDTAAADGITKLLIQFTSGTPGTVMFSQSGASGGSLTAVDGSSIAQGVSTSQVGGQQMAFALYSVPDQVGTGVVSFQASFTPNGSSAPIQSTPKSLSLIQTPVVLVHGLWDQGTVWINMQYLLNTLGINAQLVKYWDSTYKAAGPFMRYEGVVISQIKSMLNEMRASVPNSETGAAVTAADVVAHSMGGILTRQDANGPANHQSDNFNAGYIRRIITVDTPYWGSTAAPVLSLIAADSPFYSFLLGIAGHPVDKGGVQDLSPKSFAINSPVTANFVYNALTTPCCAISCYVSQDANFSKDVSSLYNLTRSIDENNLTVQQQFDVTSLLCGHDIGINALDDMQMANSLFDANANDAIVALSSQNGGYTGPQLTFAGIEHTTAPSNPLIGSFILGLLQGPVSSFSSGLPAVTQADLASQICVNLSPTSQPASKIPFLPTSPQAQISLMTLTAPSNGTEIVSGSSIAVLVQPLTNVIMAGVFIEASDSSPTCDQYIALDIITNSPFTDLIAAPTNFLGPITITALGYDDQGNYDIEQCTIQIVPGTNLAIEAISVNLNSSGTNLTFSELGVPQGIDVIGMYSDGGSRDITLGSAGTDFSTSDSSVAVVDTNGNVSAIANGSAVITVMNGGLTAHVRVQVNLQPPQITSVQPDNLWAGASNTTISITGINLGGASNVLFLYDGEPETNVTVGTLVSGANAANFQVPVSVASNTPLGSLTVVVSTPVGNSVQTSGQGNQLAIVSPLAPIVTIPPTSATAMVGSSVTFGVTATGANPLGYQWSFGGASLKDNANIAGSHTSVLTLTSVTITNAGTYEVVVTNAFGSNNASAILTVTQSTPPVIQAALQLGKSFMFKWSTISGQIYQPQSTSNLTQGTWTNVGSTIAATNSTAAFTEAIGSNFQQFYRVVLLP